MKAFKISLLIAAAIFAACSNSVTNTNTPSKVRLLEEGTPVTLPPIDTAMGKKLYNQNCAACHKETGKGGAMAIEGKNLDVDDLTTDKFKRMPDAKMYEYIIEGVPDEGMPSFKGKLKEPEMRAIVEYIRVDLQK